MGKEKKLLGFLNPEIPANLFGEEIVYFRMSGDR